MTTLLLLMLFVGSTTSQHPAIVISGPQQQIFFTTTKNLVLSCIASGSPVPSFRWEIDRMPIDNKTHHTQEHTHTSLININTKQINSTFTLQCFASNLYGTSFSNLSIVSKAEIFERIPDPQVRNISVIEGRPLQLQCLNIISHPSPTHQWSVVDGDASQDCVVDALSGRLIISAVDASMKDKVLKYHAYNYIVRRKVVGCLFRLVLLPDSHTPLNTPQLLHTTSELQVKKGETAHLMCIFAFVESIEWYKIDGSLPRLLPSHSYELKITKTTNKHGGIYKCVGVSGKSRLGALVALDIVDDPQPIFPMEDVVVSVFQKAVFRCECSGWPPVTYQWIFDPSIPAQQRGNELHIESSTSTSVITCNASNSISSYLQHAVLYVTEKSSVTQAHTSPQQSYSFFFILLLCFCVLVCFILLVVICTRNKRPYQVKFANFMFKNNLLGDSTQQTT